MFFRLKSLFRKRETRRRYRSNEEALFHAASEGDLELIQELLNAGTDVNVMSRGNTTPLTWAIEDLQYDAVVFLVERGANVNLADTLGISSLHHAIDTTYDAVYSAGQNLDLRIVEFLLRSGANPFAMDNRGQTPLDWARDRGVDAYRDVMTLVHAHREARRRRKRGHH